MSERNYWKEAEQEILSKLDIAEEYRTLGIKIISDRPTSSGWLSCHAFDRDDDTPSAGINVGDGDRRGRYRDMGGHGASMSFWDVAAILNKKLRDWRHARKFYAAKTGIVLPTGREIEGPGDKVEFLPWSSATAHAWCEAKGGFSLEAVKNAGAKLARYPAKAPVELSQFVIAFPVYGGDLLDGEPCGWVIADQTGGLVRLFHGKDKAETFHKTLSVGGTKGGLLNPYALKRLAAAEIIFKVEGLSDMLTLQSIIPPELRDKYVVISNSQGTMESIHPEWLPLLHGKVVYVIHDADKPGLIGMSRWCEALVGYAREVRSVLLPFEIKDVHGLDLRDFIMGREDEKTWGTPKTFAEVLRLCEASEIVKPKDATLVTPRPTKSIEEAVAERGMADELRAEYKTILELLELEVLGHNRDGSVEVFSKRHRTISRIHNTHRLGYSELLRIAGEPAGIYIYDGRDEMPGKKPLHRVRDAIGFTSGPVVLNNTPPLGIGCWEVDDQIVIVNSHSAAVYKKPTATTPGVLTEVVSPRCGKQILEFSGDVPWCDFKVLGTYLDKASGLDWCANTVQNAISIFDKWCWEHETDGKTTVGLLMASWVQTMLLWRPLISVTGGSNTGKSTLFETLKDLYGGLGGNVEKPTEAAVRQMAANRAVVLMLDEFEHDFNRQKVLEMFRTSSRGGEIWRGTSDQKGRKFIMKHLPWMAAIEAGLHREADKNRFIVLSIKAITPEKAAAFRQPGKEEAADLGVRLLAIAIRHIDTFRSMFLRLKQEKIPPMNSRVIESYSVPAAMLAVATGLDEVGAVKLLNELIKARSTDEPLQGDSAELLKAIMSAPVNCGRGHWQSVASIVTKQEDYNEYKAFLEGSGIALTTTRRGPRTEDLKDKTHVFFNISVIKTMLISRTKWADMDCATILKRISKEAKHVQRIIDGQRPWGIEIPFIEVMPPKPPEEGDAASKSDDAADDSNIVTHHPGETNLDMYLDLSGR